MPYMQVLLMLTTDLDANCERDQEILNRLLSTLVTELAIGSPEEDDFFQRSNKREMQLVTLRLFSVLMSRSKSWQGSMRSSKAGESNLVSDTTAKTLAKVGFKILKSHVIFQNCLISHI